MFNLLKKGHGTHRQPLIASLNHTILKTISSAILLVTIITAPGAMADATAVSQVSGDNNVPRVELSPNPAINGNVVLIEIDTRSLDRPVFGLQVKFNEKIITLAPHPSKANGVYFGLMGIPYHSKPGSTAFKLEWTTPYGYHSKIVHFTITSGEYRSEKLTVASRMVNPTSDDRQRARRERNQVKNAYLFSSSDRHWPDLFILPVESKVTSSFGTRRLFNGKLRSFHTGVDFRANEDTTIHAANAGIVRLAKNLFFSGNHVIIDHGLGVFTNYSHLSEIHVNVGDRVEKGQIIGKAGATGRVNGPHLHWGAKVNGTSVDPLQLLNVLTSLLHGSQQNL